MSESLEQWSKRQYRLSTEGLLRSISLHVTKTRPGFGQTITAAPGAVVASPVLGAYDPDPDYFYHWFRDSALVMDALRLLGADASLAAHGRQLFDEFITFSLKLGKLDGARAGQAQVRARSAPDQLKYLRPDAELAAVKGDLVVADTRVNPDGSLDVSSWARPQYDGASLRALTLLRWLPGLDPASSARAQALLESDLQFALKYGGEPCFDIWEEERGYHYYTLRVAAAALTQGASWCASQGRQDLARQCREQAGKLLATLDGYWRESEGFYASRHLEDGRPSAKALDFAVIFAALHAEAPERDSSAERHSVHDPRMLATLSRLEQLFAREYPLNRGLPKERGVAMGRYAGDKYFSGGPYFFSTLGAAEFCYRAARRGPAALAARADAFLETVRAYAPADGKLAEQFDRESGAPRSARDLAWSHAALISCLAARRQLA